MVVLACWVLEMTVGIFGILIYHNSHFLEVNIGDAEYQAFEWILAPFQAAGKKNGRRGK